MQGCAILNDTMSTGYYEYSYTLLLLYLTVSELKEFPFIPGSFKVRSISVITDTRIFLERLLLNESPI